MEETARAIAYLTHCATIISRPHAQKLTKIKHVQLAPLDETSIVVILVTDTKLVKNEVVYGAAAMDTADLMTLSVSLSGRVEGFSFEDLTDAAIADLSARYPVCREIVEKILLAAVRLLHSEDAQQVYMGGVKNILAFPEFQDIEKAQNIFDTLEQRDILLTLLSEDSSENIQIFIGSENSVLQMKDCSLIKSHYKLGNQNHGTIGVIGPTRMDYAQAVAVLDAMSRHMNQIIRAFYSP
jgi:heat-inducible transcriptional repressor